MKELVQSKVMVSFIIFVLGVLYINSVSINREVKMQEEDKNVVVAYNK